MLRLHCRPPSAAVAGRRVPGPPLSKSPPFNLSLATCFGPPLRPPAQLTGTVAEHRLRAVSDDGGVAGGIDGGDGIGGGGGGGGWSGGNSEGSGQGAGGGDENRWTPFSWYITALDKHPVLTKSITSGILNLIGDLICQLLVDQAAKVDTKRAFLFGFLGFALVGPTLHHWYLYLSKVITIKGSSGAIVRLLLDQFFFAPIFIAVFMASLVTLEGKPSLVVPQLQQELLPSVKANWQLWIPFQFLNFYFIPQKFQVLAGNFVALAWNVILSFKTHNEVILK